MKFRVTVRAESGSDQADSALPIERAEGGPFERLFGGYGARVQVAAEIAVKGLAETIKQRARARVRAGGFQSSRMATIVGSRFYDNRRRPAFSGPIGIVESRWRTKLGDKDKLAPFVTGEVLRPLTAKRLIVPLKKGPAFAAMVRERLLQLGADPSLGIARLPGGRMLVYDRRAGRKGLALAILTPTVTMPKRIDFSGVDANAGPELVTRFNAAMDGAAQPTG